MKIEKEEFFKIGCGNGALANVLYKKGFKNITAIDLCPESIKIAKLYNKNIDYECGDAISVLSTSSEKFDVIYSRAVFEHFNKNEVLKNIEIIVDSLSDNGVLLIDVPNMDHIWASHERYMDFTHDCGFSSDSLFEILKMYFGKVDIVYEDIDFLNNSMTFKNHIAREIIYRLYRWGGVGVSKEALFSRAVVACARNKYSDK